MSDFHLISPFEPQGDQGQAIEKLFAGLQEGRRYQTLLGVTGSGKTYTMANVIAQWGRPTLVMSHNKTLAAQLYGEFRAFFPNNAVEFFISYYDYYQPEAYLPASDVYIEKETDVNDEIDRLRLRATSALLSRQDVIIVASVSSIYGLGSPGEYERLLLFLKRGATADRKQILRKLVDIHYTRNDVSLPRGTFRARGDVIEIHPAYDETAIRVEMFGDEIESMSEINILTGNVIRPLEQVVVYPAKHFVTTEPNLRQAMVTIREELEERLKDLRSQGKLLEAQRLEQRTRFDLEMMAEVGYCSGIENYSRHLSGRKAGEPPATLFDYFPKDYLLMVDESHVTVPQIRGMYRGDRSRKEMLVEYGFRLPSALDNRPLYFEEWEARIAQAVFVSATPADWEIEKSGGEVVEQIIRPTGLMEPAMDVRPIKGQIDDLIEEIRTVVEKKERVLVLTLTKRMAEDLTEYLRGMDIRVRYLHSEIDSLQRVDILRDLRLAEFDVLVGINLLREGLDLPEVSLVAILDADKEGFLRSARSLFQISGRAARHINGRVILYADQVTDSIQAVLDETNRRRELQRQYNKEHGITPRSVVKSVEEVKRATLIAEGVKERATKIEVPEPQDLAEAEELVARLEKMMRDAASKLEFERAAEIRDEIERIRQKMIPVLGKK
jgi:excinuclease ABC subunit B